MNRRDVIWRWCWIGQWGRQRDRLRTSRKQPLKPLLTTRWQGIFKKMMETQDESFQARLQSFMEAPNKRVDDRVRETAKEVADLRASLQYTQKEVDQIKNAISEHSEHLSNTTRDVEMVTAAQHEIEDGIDYLENQSRRNNLRIDGVAESAAETWADTMAAVRKTLKLSEQQTNDVNIERAHRTGGNKHSGKPKTVPHAKTNPWFVCK